MGHTKHRHIPTVSMRVLLVLLVIAVFGQTFAKPSLASIKKLVKALQEKKAAINEDKSWSGSGSWSSWSGSRSSGYNYFDWVQYVQDRCGFDLAEAYANYDTPVDIQEYGSVLAAVQSMPENLVGASDSTQQGLDALESNLADPNTDLEGFIMQHGGLAERFGEAFEGMYNIGFCAIVRISPARERMELNGLQGFATDTKCNRVGVYLMGLYMTNNWDEGLVSAAVWADIHGLGEKMRDDVRCLLQDVRDFRDFANGITVDASMSARQAMLTIDALQGYIENIGNDAMNYLGSVENIGHLIDYEEKEAQKKAKKQQQLKKKLNNLLKTMRNLR